MSTEVTPDLLRRVAAAWEGGTASDDYARHELRARADHLECGKTPGQTLWEASLAEGTGHAKVSTSGQYVADWADKSNVIWHPSCERIAAAVLAAHGTPTLTPAGEHPEPGTRGLLPVVLNGEVWCCKDPLSAICGSKSEQGRAILADPRPDGAHE